MKKLTAFVLVAAAALALPAASPAPLALRVATVSMVDLVRFHPQRAADRRYMRSKEKDYQSRLDSAREELQNLATSCQKLMEDAQNPMLSAAAKADVQKKLKAEQEKYLGAQQSYRANIQSFQEELQDDDNRFLRERTDEIRAKIDGYAKEKKYDLIVDSSMVAFAGKDLDVTDDILKLFGVDPAKARAEAKAAADENAAATDALTAAAMGGTRPLPTKSTLPAKAPEVKPPRTVTPVE